MQEIFLSTDRLYLRRMTEKDFSDIALMLKNPKVVYAWEYNFSDIDVSEWILKNIERYTKYSLGYFLVCDKNTNEVLGQVALVPDVIEGNKYYEIGYMFKYEHWHKGYASECVKYLIDYAFNRLNINEVIFEIRPENSASIKVAEKFGAVVYGSFNKNVKNKVMKHLIFKIKKDKYYG